MTNRKRELEIADAAEEVREWVLLALRKIEPAESRGQRLTLVACYLDTAIEHHESITLLIRDSLYGSAFALARPLYESVVRGLWVNRCATEDQVKQLCREDTHEKLFPGSRDLFSALDMAYGTDRQFQCSKRDWQALCSYTHSGLRQLGRRGFSGAKQHGYSTKAVIQILDWSTTSLTDLAKVFLNESGFGLWTLVVLSAENRYYEHLK